MGEAHAGVGEDRREDAAEADRLVLSMLARARRGVPVGVLVSRWLGDDLDPVLRGAVTMRLGSALAGALAVVWRRGWQPGDLVHAARRTLTAGQVQALAQGIREELGTYARSTVDPRWWEQVAVLGDGAEDPRPRGRRRPRPTSAGAAVAWAERCGDVVTVTLFVERLPQLQVLGPVPGDARYQGGEAAADVDDKLLTKVRRLLAQAEGTPYEAEAETFTAAAQSLMARHRIDRAMLEADDDQAGRGPGAVRLCVDRPYEQPKVLLLSVVASANRCRALWNQSVGFATVVGHAPDRRAVEILFTSLLVQATTAMQREGERHDVAARTRGFRSSFLSGFAARIGQRLEEASHAAEDAAIASVEAATAGARADGAPPATGAGRDRMALVLRRRDEEVEQLVRELFPRTVRTRSRTISDQTGWMQGRAAADRATLSVGGRLTGGAS